MTLSLRLVFCIPLFANSISALDIVTTTPDIASITSSITEGEAEVQSLTTGVENLHAIKSSEEKIELLKKADLLISNGVALERPWLKSAMKKSKNDLIKTKQGHCVTADAIKLLTKKEDISTRSSTYHPLANPHYWLDPINGIRMAKHIMQCISQIDPNRSKLYQYNFEKFRRKTKALTRNILKKMKPHRGKKIGVYHYEFLYLLKRLGLRISFAFEGHIIRPNDRERFHTPIILTTPWSNNTSAKRIADSVGSRLIIVPTQTGSAPRAKTYLDMIENAVEILDSALNRGSK